MFDVNAGSQNRAIACIRRPQTKVGFLAIPVSEDGFREGADGGATVVTQVQTKTNAHRQFGGLTLQEGCSERI